MPKEKIIKFRLKVPAEIENYVLFELVRKPLVQIEAPIGKFEEINLEMEIKKINTLEKKLKDACEKLMIRNLQKANIDDAKLYLDPNRILSEINQVYERIDEIYKKTVHYLDQIAISETKKVTTEFMSEYDKIAKEFYPIACKIYTALEILRKLVEIKRNIRRDGKFTVIEGWILKKNKKKLEKIVNEIRESYTADVYIEFLEKIKDLELVPTKLAFPKAISPFVSMIKSVGIPAAYEIDPTIIFWIFWVIMFGFMFPDFGQGLVVLVLAFYIRKKKEFLGFSGKKLSTLLIWCGIAAMVTGLIFGEIFMFEVPSVLNVIGPIIGLDIGLPEGWVKDPKYVILMLKVSIFFGILQILLGLMFGTINNLRRGKYIEAVLSVRGLAGILLFISLLMLGFAFLRGGFQLTTSTYLTIGMLGLSMLMIIILPFFEKEHTLSDAFGDLLEASISFVSNVLSYIRLAGFALAHLIFGAVLTEIWFGAFPLWLKLMMAGMFNFIGVTIEFLVVGIQATRLGLYEFMTKFYEGTGRLFYPTVIHF